MTLAECNIQGGDAAGEAVITSCHLEHDDRILLIIFGSQARKKIRHKPCIRVIATADIWHLQNSG
eukprot:CCRYP_009502-RC/>CCRYP_009502-RC protein AED:0.02 eAED:0.02 QI:2910/1/1/1/0.66/0.5/4/1711/64